MDVLPPQEGLSKLVRHVPSGFVFKKVINGYVNPEYFLKTKPLPDAQSNVSYAVRLTDGQQFVFMLDTEVEEVYGAFQQVLPM